MLFYQIVVANAESTRVDSRPWPRIGGPHEYLFAYRFNFS